MESKSKDKVNPERKRQRFSAEFKREAVRLLELGKKPGTQLALELGVARNRIYKWQAQLKSNGGVFRTPGRPTVAEESELSRLKRELKRVTEELEILKKAETYFA
ncbi:MAG: transposase, partial [Sideroxydans sp.]|nr:transposase [Sideroxydans sp.]